MSVRLNENRENEGVMDKIDAWAIAHANILMPLSIVTLFILFALLCAKLCGLAAVESGMLRNFLAGGV